MDGEKIYIKLSKKEVNRVKVGQKFYLTTPSGRKKALAVVVKKQGFLVLAQLKKGKARRGFKTQWSSRFRKRKKKRYQKPKEYSVKQESADSYHPLSLGFMGGLGWVHQTVEIGKTVRATGHVFGARGLLDYSLLEDLGVQGRFGVQRFKVAKAVEATDISHRIDYLALDLLFRYSLLGWDTGRFFIKGGAGIYHPFNKEVDGTLNPDSVATTTLLIGGVGVDFSLSPSMSLFMGGEYFYYPPSSTVSTHEIQGQVGVLFAL